ncbi:hypothetical protein [Amylolactobacillus amylophilus]|uniref:hypothetical protein n=1 Tax=Amylolactobacillus amylophilus TaxID=1603 RepID=UPI000A4AC784|nr:hypothetical protein [Amylolactobacillus amylophilus]
MDINWFINIQIFFANLGHDVVIYHKLSNSNKPIPNSIRSLKRKIDFAKNEHKVDWFFFNSNVRLIPGVYKDEHIRDADVIIATAVSTAEFVSSLPAKAGSKYYFIQNYENWGGYTNEMVDASYRLPMKKNSNFKLVGGLR